MKKTTFHFLFFLSIGAILLSTLASSFPIDQKWGFFGHRRINRMAVFTLPPEMIVFFKKKIEYITEHAVDPDKRRYASRFEAIRHYIDIDHWGEHPFPEVPREWTEALMTYADVYVINTQGDSLQIMGKNLRSVEGDTWLYSVGKVNKEVYRDFFRELVEPQYYEDEWVLDCDAVQRLLGVEAGWDCQKIIVVDRFSEYGVVPYHLLKMQYNMTEAFMQRNPDRILRICAEMGHYIGDAHVPLHTTENYNGQLTDQVGIHAFWESRIPELFADVQYDYFVGKAEYIENPKEYYWQIVLDSHQLLDSVLAIEKDLSLTFPNDKQYCYENRLDNTVRLECRDYAAAYQRRLNGMVEQRMGDAILSIGSAWYTAWIDAGQPDLSTLVTQSPGRDELTEREKLEAEYQKGESKGRTHGN
jgi:hypothetical protein